MKSAQLEKRYRKAINNAAEGPGRRKAIDLYKSKVNQKLSKNEPDYP